MDPSANVSAEVEKWEKLAKEAGMDEMVSNIKQFQEWLTGIPGIDEATALARCGIQRSASQHDA